MFLSRRMKEEREATIKLLLSFVFLRILKKQPAWLSRLVDILVPEESAEHSSPGILSGDHQPQILQRTLQFPIFGVVVERDYWDAVLWLQEMAVGGVVQQHHFTQFAIHHSQIFEVKTFFESAVLAVETVGYKLLFGVEVVKYDISIGGTASRKYYDFCKLRQLLQKLTTKRPYPYARLHYQKVTDSVPPRQRGKFSFTVQLLEFQSQCTRVQSRSRYTVLREAFLRESLMSLRGCGILKDFDCRSTSMHWQKCWRQRFMRQVVSSFLRQLASLPWQQVLHKRWHYDFQLCVSGSGSSGLLPGRLMEGSFSRGCRFSGRRLVLAISRARVLILSSEKEGLDFIFYVVRRVQFWPRCLQAQVVRVQTSSYFFCYLLLRGNIGVRYFYLLMLNLYRPRLQHPTNRTKTPAKHFKLSINHHSTQLSKKIGSVLDPINRQL